MEEKRSPAVRAAIVRGRKQLDVFRMILADILGFVSSALGVIVGLVVLVPLGSAIGVVAYLTFRRW